MCKNYNYKGLIIYVNDKGSRFGTKYYSVVNPHKSNKYGKKLHAHTTSKGLAKKIIDCYYNLINMGTPGHQYSLYIRNKACRLMGLNIFSKS